MVYATSCLLQPQPLWDLTTLAAARKTSGAVEAASHLTKATLALKSHQHLLTGLLKIRRMSPPRTQQKSLPNTQLLHPRMPPLLTHARMVATAATHLVVESATRVKVMPGPVVAQSCISAPLGARLRMWATSARLLRRHRQAIQPRCPLSTLQSILLNSQQTGRP